MQHAGIWGRKAWFTAFIFILFCILACRMYFPTTKDPVQMPVQAASLSRGKNLVFTICAGCHLDFESQRFTGRDLNDLPKIAGHLYSANLTHSTVAGKTRDYTDAELFYLLKTGISRSGKFMPYMMRPMMADNDAWSIISFLRSDDPSLAAVDSTVGKTRINFIGKTGLRILASPQPYTRGVQQPDENNPVVYGRYLVGIIGCFHCHSGKAKGLDYEHPEESKKYLQGGMKLKDPKGKKIFSPNLTPDRETGIGNFTEKDFSLAVREGIAPSGRKLSPPMGHFSALTDAQVHALYTYLNSLPPVHHAVKRRKE